MTKTVLIFFGALLIASLVVDYSIYKERNQGYVYYQSNYNSIYYPLDFSAIKKIEGTDSDSISVILSDRKEETEWNIAINKINNYTVRGKYPRIYLPSNNNTYESDVTVCDSRTDFCFEMRLQRQDIGDIQIVTSSIPYTSVERYSFAKFCNVDWIVPAEKEFISKVLKDELMIDTCTNTLSKIKLITSHINTVANRDSNIGLKFPWNAYTACQIYQSAVEGKTNMTCNEYSEIFYLFANLGGINTRRVGVVGLGNSDGIVKISGHHFNESFIPEQNKWAFVDITSQKAFVQNSENQVLNTFELLMANMSGNYNDLTAVKLSGDSVIITPYSEIRENEEYYFDRDCLIQFKFGNDRFDVLNQINRYLFDPEPVLSLNYSNSKLFLKNLLFFVTIISFLVSIILGLYLVSKRKNS